MTKLKLGLFVDDKPVKLTLELSAQVHRDLVAYAEVFGGRKRPGGRSGKAGRADAGALHGDGSGFCESA